MYAMKWTDCYVSRFRLNFFILLVEYLVFTVLKCLRHSIKLS
jgi:hypothetical protein